MSYALLQLQRKYLFPLNILEKIQIAKYFEVQQKIWSR